MSMQLNRRIITESPQDLLIQYGSEITQDPRFLALKDRVHHYNSNLYDHCVAVTLCALEVAKDLQIKVDPGSLVRGCLLHDYFLYDCHAKGHPWFHMTRHGMMAAQNAMRDFGINPVEADMIANHMWPLHPFRFPLCIEGWILTLADKKVSVKERFTKKKKTVLDQ
ncbi:MAG: HD family phosphohydrolase [Bacilli bacterium]|nr:HD family phosphohydrolase [Bacilli bacterium]